MTTVASVCTTETTSTEAMPKATDRPTRMRIAVLEVN